MRIVVADAERAAELRALARREPNARTRVRLLGVANVLGGMAIWTDPLRLDGGAVEIRRPCGR